MSTSSQRPSSSSRDLTLVVESESGTPEEYFAQVALSLGRAKSNTIHIDHPDVDHIHAKVVKRDEAFWLRCEGQAKLKVLDPEPGEVEEVELIPGLTIELGGVTIRCRRQIKGMSSLSDDYWADAAGGERFRVEADSFTGNLPKKIGPVQSEVQRIPAKPPEKTKPADPLHLVRLGVQYLQLGLPFAPQPESLIPLHHFGMDMIHIRMINMDGVGLGPAEAQSHLRKVFLWCSRFTLHHQRQVTRGTRRALGGGGH
jgi:hypothetical protein